MQQSSIHNPDDLAHELLERWLRLFPPDAAASAGRVFGLMLLGYLSEHRHYHNLAHIDACLRELDSARHLAADARAVELAIFFHDAIYDPRAADNEARSAELARLSLRELGQEPALVEYVATLVLATKHAAPPDLADQELIADIDLSILGQPGDVFNAYDDAIRLEYQHVPDQAYRAGRLAVQEHFLKRERIYQSDFFHDRYERAARGNLRQACARLAKEAES